MTNAQTFFMISGVIFWFIAIMLLCGYLVHLILKDIPDPQPKGRTVGLTGVKRNRQKW